MRSASSLRRTLLPLLLLPAAIPFLLHAQNPAAPPSQPAAVTSAPQPAPLTPAQQLAADTEHLQQLATELKAAMDKSTKDTLSMPVIKKAQEVEKLAHKVRDEMRTSLPHGA